MADYLDGIDGSGVASPADLKANASDAANSAGQISQGSFVVTKEGYDVVANKTYPFSFVYLYSNPDNPSQLIPGPRSANFLVTLETPDLTQPVTNLVVTPGLLSYGVKWDLIDRALPTNKWLIDIQIYESLTGAFAGEEYLVWNGNGNSATILVSNTANRWIRVDTRDQDYRKKSVISARFNATDPVVVDNTGPANVTSVTVAESGIDTSGYLGFNAYANISWPAVTGGGIRGYRIRFSNDNGATYSYVDSPGTGTTYKLAGLAIGSTYQVAVATYDEYNNTSSSYVSGPNVTVAGTPSVSNYISGGPFQFGVGVGSVSTNKGLYFDASNYWYVNATNSARLKVGGATSNYLLWDGSTFAIDGNITARGGTFSGNVYMSTSGASIYNGTIDSTTGNLTGNGFALNSTGLKVASGTKSVTISAADGTITANAGSIAGWTLSDNTLSKNKIIIDSSGKIQIGSTAAASIYLQSITGSGPVKEFVIWAGNNTPDANAKFRVAADGTLYATNAVISGDITANSIAFGAQYDGTSLSTIKSGAATGSTALQPGGNLTGSVNGVAVATVTSGAAKGATAVQDGNGVTVDATTKKITELAMSSGLKLKSGGTKPVWMDDTGLYMKNANNDYSIFLNSSTGDAVFRGTIYASAGEFTGKVTADSGSFTGTITTGNGSVIGDWKVDADGTLGSGLGLGGTYLFANGLTSGNGATFSVYTGKMIFAGQGFSSTSGTPLVFVNTSPQISSAGGVRINDAFVPSADNAYSLGYTGNRWQIVRSAGGVSTTSDARLKTNINDSGLGLNFIKALRPVSYKMIIGGKVPKDGQGKIVLDGSIIEPELIDRPGVRTHWGFLAQEVKQAADSCGVEDFAGWQLDDPNDLNSGQSLVHHEFIGPMAKAIQELSDMVESLQEEVNTLKGI